MKWMGIFFVGYLVMLAGIVAALWYGGILERVGGTWTAIGVVIALGLGIMLAVARGGTKQTIDIDQH